MTAITGFDHFLDHFPIINEQRKRCYLTLPGIVFPEEWDELSEEFKKERLDTIDQIGIES
jgi:hypothetical protein